MSTNMGYFTKKNGKLEKVSWVQIALITEPFTAKIVDCGIQIATIVMIWNFEAVSDDFSCWEFVQLEIMVVGKSWNSVITPDYGLLGCDVI